MNKDNIVSVNIMGGLGNQMFQLASAYAYAKKYGGSLKVEKNKRYNDGRPLYWDSILQHFNKFLVDRIPNNLIQWNEKEATLYTPIPSLSSPGIYLNGYFQSSKYFYDTETENEIKKLFEPTDSMLNVINQKYEHLLSNKDRVIVVHARRTDYLRNQDIINFHGPLSIEYYKKAIKQVSDNIKNPIFLLASDDPTFWNSVINECEELRNNNYILNDENEINTLVLLQQFKYFIIANSTFSWWCAWLSNNPELVIAPSKWFGPTGPQNYQDIYMPSWHKI